MEKYYLVLDDYLLKIFYKFKKGIINNNVNILTNLLNYYKKHITNVKQLQRIKLNDNALIKQLASRGLISQSLEELAQKTLIKMILCTDKTYYPYININGDIFESNFTATYANSINRDKAINHILDLIKNGDEIEIYDKYLLDDNGDHVNTDRNHFSINLLEILIQNNLQATFKIFCKNNKNRERQRKNYLINSFPNRLIFSHNNLNEHDRYIRIYKNRIKKYEIILSSGFYNLKNLNKDITYIVRIL